jgi:hypothetical protein
MSLAVLPIVFSSGRMLSKADLMGASQALELNYSHHEKKHSHSSNQAGLPNTQRSYHAAAVAAWRTLDGAAFS